MMLEHFGLREEAELINTNIDFMIRKGLVTQDLHSHKFISCSKVGDVLSLLLDHNISDVRFENMFEGKLPVI